MSDRMFRGRPVKASSAQERALIRAYLLAKQHVIASGFEDEIAWQEETCPSRVTGASFVREAAWVVFCSGMRESIVRGRFGDLGRAFGSWCPGYICDHRRTCLRRARPIFNHPGKLNAVINIAQEVDTFGVETLLNGIYADGPAFLTRFPYVGEVTCFHLAKNLGYAVAKPDRHLNRVAASLGYSRVADLCEDISSTAGDPVHVVDVILWRFATLRSDYELWFQEAFVAGTCWGQQVERDSYSS